MIRSGKETAAAGPQPPKFSEISYAGRGLAAHKEMNVAIRETMPKDRASASYTQVPTTTLDGGDFGELEHYRQAFNAADFGISDGQDRLGPGAMSVVGLPPLNTPSDTYLGLGYRMFRVVVWSTLCRIDKRPCFLPLPASMTARSSTSCS